MIDVLAFGAHPDDIELGCAGTLLRLHQKGYRFAMVDLTAGEMGSRGSVTERAEEAQKAAKILQSDFRVNLGMADGNIENTPQTRQEIIKVIREFKPNLVFAPYPDDRHPDHIKASHLVTEAAFYAGIAKVAPEAGKPFRPKRVIYYPMSYEFTPSFYVDISAFYDRKVESIKAHRSQFFNPEYQGEATFISSQDYWEALSAKARHYGWLCGVKYAEPFWVREALLLDDLPAVLTHNQM